MLQDSDIKNPQFIQAFPVFLHRLTAVPTRMAYKAKANPVCRLRNRVKIPHTLQIQQCPLLFLAAFARIPHGAAFSQNRRSVLPGDTFRIAADGINHTGCNIGMGKETLSAPVRKIPASGTDAARKIAVMANVCTHFLHCQLQ